MIRRIGESLRPGVCYFRRPGVYAVLRRGDSVLMTHQSAPTPELQLPGGGIDPGESPFHALHREVMEETGWSMGRARRLGAFRRYTYMPEYDLWAEKVCTVYEAVPGRRHGPPTEPEHLAVWMPLRRAAEEAGNAGDRMFLRQICQRMRR